VVRYQKLEGALSAFDAAGGKDRADALEAQAARLRANVNGSDRLKSDPAVNDALTAFAGTKPPDALIAAYNTAVRQYQQQRTGTGQRPVARVFGYDARPILVLRV
jgi:hypothetical protein